MEGFLGETIVAQKDSPFKDYRCQDWAMMFIAKYGQIDGDHHAKWVLDQVARILCGCPVVIKKAEWKNHKPEWRFTVEKESPAYQIWREEMLGKTLKDGSREYDYNEGIPP